MADTPPLHGGNVHAAATGMGLGAADILDFSSNCNGAVRSITARLATSVAYPFDMYPDPDCIDLRKALAVHEDTVPDQVLVGNGSSELIHLAISALAPRRALVVGPTYVEYSRALASASIPVDSFDLPRETEYRFTPHLLDSLLERCSGADAIFLCSPNNPTGSFLDPVPVIQALKPGQTLILDTAYHAFLHGTEHYAPLRYSRLQELVPQGAALLVLASPTKFFHCPGVRLGWCLSDTQTIDLLQAHRAPWMVSGYAQNLGLLLMEHVEEYREATRDLPLRRQALASDLSECAMMETVYDSCANFLLARLKGTYPAGRLCAELLRQRMLVRDCSTIPGLETDNCIRVQVLEPPANRQLAMAMAAMA